VAIPDRLIADIYKLLADMIDRRTFLQQSLLGLLTLGISEAGIFALESNPRYRRYRQALAQATNRKLALLVGIDRYPQRHLNGCSIDLELQRELLIDRFGFKPQDIITLVDRQATRENIETAFIEHLSEQAKVDDIVVFHFSGYGNQVKMPLEENNYKLVNSLVPADALFPTKGESAANDLLQDTLMLLAQSLTTDRLSIILDTSFSTVAQPLLGNLKVRSSFEIAEHPSPEELAFQEQLQLKLAAKGIKPTKRFLTSPGILVMAAGKNQVAVEGQWDGFNAGLFTYALTQYLWHVTPNSKVRVAMQRTNEAVERVTGKQQQPTIDSIIKPTIAYYTNSGVTSVAEAVVSGVSNNNIELKLLGLPAAIVNYYGINSCLITLAADETIWLQIKSKEGFKAKAQIIDSTIDSSSIEVGQPLREAVRILPRNLGLRVALDIALERIERVDATSAFANIVTVNSVTAAGEQNADVLLDKVTKDEINYTEIKSNSDKEPEINTSSSYALFSAGGILIPNTQGAANEAVKSAIGRLAPKFDNLLAAKWLQLMVNEFSSTLKVLMSVNSIAGGSSNSLLLHRATQLVTSQLPATAAAKAAFPGSDEISIPALTKNTELQFKLQNSSPVPLYVIVLEIDGSGSLSALYTPRQARTNATNEFDNLELPPQQELLIPPVENSWQWKTSDTPGMTEVYGIFSVEPFTQTLQVLSTTPDLKLNRDRLSNLPNSLAIVRGILQDLHQASGVGEATINSNLDVYALRVDRWATLNCIYKVVEM
jgi:hypothetical protein